MRGTCRHENELFVGTYPEPMVFLHWRDVVSHFSRVDRTLWSFDRDDGFPQNEADPPRNALDMPTT